MRAILYSLREIEGKTILSIDLGGNIISENTEQIQLLLPQGPATLPKAMYMNKDRIFDNGKVFFYVCSKQVDRDYIFNRLLEYASKKLDTRIAHLQALKERFLSERKKLKVAA